LEGVVLEGFRIHSVANLSSEREVEGRGDGVAGWGALAAGDVCGD
jgi:hypothetical protein